MIRTRETTRRGMTLIELVAAVAILGSLVAMLLGIVRSSLSARQMVTDHTRLLDRAHGVMDLVVRDLEMMHVYDSRAYLMVEPQRFTLADRGTVDGTSFAFPAATPLRVTPEFRDRPGLVEIAYLPADPLGPDRGLRLFRREFFVETDVQATAIRHLNEGFVLLADDLTEFRLEFLPPPETDERTGLIVQPLWQAEWEGGFGVGNLPQAVRIVVGVRGEENPDRTFTLERVVRLPVASVTVEMQDQRIKQELGFTEETGNVEETGPGGIGGGANAR